jgi:hypothetical protein
MEEKFRILVTNFLDRQHVATALLASGYVVGSEEKKRKDFLSDYFIIVYEEPKFPEYK